MKARCHHEQLYFPLPLDLRRVFRLMPDRNHVYSLLLVQMIWSADTTHPERSVSNLHTLAERPNGRFRTRHRI